MASRSTDSGYVDNWQGDKTLSECNLHMLTSEDSCDVSFRVGENEDIVRCHRYILISRSCVFHAMLCGPLAEKDDIKVPDVCKDLFADFLKFLYTDKCCLTPENVTGMMYLSKKYAVGGLEEECRSLLKMSLSADNACIILEQARLFDEKNLQDEALKVILKQGCASLNTTGFKDLCREYFDKILKSDELCAKPDQIFSAVLTWADAECGRQGKEVSPQNQRTVLGESIYWIPFTSFEAPDFVQMVVPSQILSASESLKIMSYCACPETDTSPFRIFHRIEKIYEAEVYESTSPVKDPDVELFRNEYVNDNIRVMSDHHMYLQGLVLQAGDGATYTISVKCQSKELLSREYKTRLSSWRIIFDESIVLNRYSQYDIAVQHSHGKSPDFLGSVLKEKVKFGTFTMTTKRMKHNENDRGLLSKLIIGIAPYRIEK